MRHLHNRSTAPALLKRANLKNSRTVHLPEPREETPGHQRASLSLKHSDRVCYRDSPMFAPVTRDKIKPAAPSAGMQA